jgi:hypothetical protein
MHVNRRHLVAAAVLVVVAAAAVAGVLLLRQPSWAERTRVALGSACPAGTPYPTVAAVTQTRMLFDEQLSPASPGTTPPVSAQKALEALLREGPDPGGPRSCGGVEMLAYANGPIPYRPQWCTAANASLPSCAPPAAAQLARGGLMWVFAWHEDCSAPAGAGPRVATPQHYPPYTCAAFTMVDATVGTPSGLEEGGPQLLAGKPPWST